MPSDLVSANQRPAACFYHLQNGAVLVGRLEDEKCLHRNAAAATAMSSSSESLFATMKCYNETGPDAVYFFI